MSVLKLSMFNYDTIYVNILLRPFPDFAVFFLVLNGNKSWKDVGLICMKYS